jgi:2'-5' RNA ligase
VRLFVGIELEADVAAAAGELARTLRARVERLAPHARLTWIPPERLHLTVRFIGEVNAERAELIRGALAPDLPVAPFHLTIAGTGAFPPRGAPRVLWTGLREGLDSLRHVEGLVTERLRAVGIPPEARAYSPHLTLARVRDASGLPSTALFEGVTHAVVGTTHVGTITLFESRLSPKGPTYRADLTVRLRER